jgi:hypothetical protein
VVVVNTRSAILRSMDKNIYIENHNSHAENVVCVTKHQEEEEEEEEKTL